jgi:tetratricopeptide (TPR) repeat protein
MAAAIKRLGADMDNALVAQAQAIIVNAQSPLTPQAIAQLKSYLENGGRVLLQGAGADHRTLLKQLAGTEVRITTPTPPNFNSRMILFWNDPITDGLSNQDFFWNLQPESENYAAPFDDKSYAIEPLIQCAYEGPGVEALSYPAGLARVRVGKGTLYLSSIRWDSATEARRPADRIAYTLLGNMGVNFKPTQRAERLTNLEYQTLDIQKHLNRTLADEVAEDGKGGFTDQGPDSDLHTLSTGRQMMSGVPFDIAAPNSCLTLASKYRPGDAPQAVRGIKIGRRADALYFVHTCAWTGRGVQGIYRIHYADGKSIDILLEGSTNLRDWASSSPEAPFPFETGTLTRAGWTGSCKHFAKVSVYVMEWANPRPEVELVSFDFISGNQGVPVLLAVTSGTKSKQETFVKGDVEAARKLDDEARQAADKGDRVKAMELVRAALAKDATCNPARSRLADLLNQAGQVEQAEAELRKVIQIDPQYLDAYLKIGSMCEQAKRWDDAIAIYRQSLQANVNQPPVLQALERVKKQGH